MGFDIAIVQFMDTGFVPQVWVSNVGLAGQRVHAISKVLEEGLVSRLEAIYGSHYYGFLAFIYQTQDQEWSKSVICME